MHLLKQVLFSLLLFAVLKSGSQNIYAFAGNGTIGFSGDGGQALQAQLYYPGGIAIDASGNIYIGDYQNHRIRKIDPTGIITTIGGGGMSYADGIPATSALIHEPTGIAVDGAGNVFFAERILAQVRKINTSGIITTIAGNGTQGFPEMEDQQLRRSLKPQMESQLMPVVIYISQKGLIVE